jgi:site-specific DNA-methyltransferase (adenine-specific)
MDYIKQMPDKFVDLAICDPPYGINADKKNSGLRLQSKKSASMSKDYGNQQWDSDIPQQTFFDELKRVSKNQIIWGANYFGLTGGYIYWRKNVTMPTYSTGELAYCSLINKIDEYEYTWHGMLQQNMSNKEERIHPTQKPIALYKWLLTKYAKPNDKILDTHVGSASSLIACEDLGFDYVGYELDPDYYKSACKRIEQFRSQLKLSL